MRLRLLVFKCLEGEKGSVRITINLAVNSIYKEPRLEPDNALFTTCWVLSLPRTNTSGNGVNEDDSGSLRSLCHLVSVLMCFGAGNVPMILDEGTQEARQREPLSRLVSRRNKPCLQGLQNTATEVPTALL